MNGLVGWGLLVGKGVTLMIIDNNILADFMFWNHFHGIIIQNNNYNTLYKEAWHNCDFMSKHPRGVRNNRWTNGSAPQRCFSSAPPPSGMPNSTQPLNLSLSDSNVLLYLFPSYACMLWLFLHTWLYFEISNLFCFFPSKFCPSTQRQLMFLFLFKCVICDGISLHLPF